MSEAIRLLRDDANRAAIGGKARGLAKLIAAGFSSA